MHHDTSTVTSTSSRTAISLPGPGLGLLHISSQSQGPAREGESEREACRFVVGNMCSAEPGLLTELRDVIPLLLHLQPVLLRSPENHPGAILGADFWHVAFPIWACGSFHWLHFKSLVQVD